MAASVLHAVAMRRHRGRAPGPYALAAIATLEPGSSSFVPTATGIVKWLAKVGSIRSGGW
jgi:hypothetical protein